MVYFLARIFLKEPAPESESFERKLDILLKSFALEIEQLPVSTLEYSSIGLVLQGIFLQHLIAPSDFP